MRTHLPSNILLLTAALVASVAMVPAAEAQTAKKPNVLVIWGDDIGTENIASNKKFQVTHGLSCHVRSL